MSEMEDRVAQAQAGERWESFDEEQKSAARQLAGIAIKAMRRPTNNMVYAAIAAGCTRNTFEGWRAMIDEALR